MKDCFTRKMSPKGEVTFFRWCKIEISSSFVRQHSDLNDHWRVAQASNSGCPVQPNLRRRFSNVSGRSVLCMRNPHSRPKEGLEWGTRTRSPHLRIWFGSSELFAGTVARGAPLIRGFRMSEIGRAHV